MPCPYPEQCEGGQSEMRSDIVAAADQTSIDAGPWVLSGVALLEPPPPFHSFAPHQSPTPQEMNIHLYWIQGGWSSS